MDTIGRQVTTFVTLFMAVGLILLMYLIFEPQRRSAAADAQIEQSAARGAELFAANCVQCHGPQGQGIAGAGYPLDIEDNWEPDDDRREYLRNVIYRGRQNSNGTQPNMPAFLNTEGGALHTGQIEDLINFIGYGNWEEVPPILEGKFGTPVAAIPTPPNLGTPITPARQGQVPAAVGSDPNAQLFVTQCGTCHRINPEYPSGGAIGPNLSGIAVRGRIPSSQPSINVDKEGLTRWIRNPSAIRPGTAMPAFGPDRISDDQLSSMVDWLLQHTEPAQERRRRR